MSTLLRLGIHVRADVLVEIGIFDYYKVSMKLGGAALEPASFAVAAGQFGNRTEDQLTRFIRNPCNCVF